MNSSQHIDDSGAKVTSSSSHQNYINSSFNVFQDINNIPSKKITVGDMDINYKIFGKGKPLLLISGSGNVVDVWPIHFLQELSKLHKVIIFDIEVLEILPQGKINFQLNNSLMIRQDCYRL